MLEQQTGVDEIKLPLLQRRFIHITLEKTNRRQPRRGCLLSCCSEQLTVQIHGRHSRLGMGLGNQSADYPGTAGQIKHSLTIRQPHPFEHLQFEPSRTLSLELKPL